MRTTQLTPPQTSYWRAECTAPRSDWSQLLVVELSCANPPTCSGILQNSGREIWTDNIQRLGKTNFAQTVKTHHNFNTPLMYTLKLDIAFLL